MVNSRNTANISTWKRCFEL